MVSVISVSNGKDLLHQHFYLDRISHTLYSFYLKKSKINQEPISFSFFGICSICGKFSNNKKFVFEIFVAKINKLDFVLSGYFCHKHGYQVAALQDCITKINELKKEIKNVKTNSNGRPIKRVSMQYDGRY